MWCLRTVAICTLLSFYGVAGAQTDTLFWFAAPEVSLHTENYDRPIVFRITTGAQAATITISQPVGAGIATPLVNNIAANSTQTINLTNWIDAIENKPPNTVLNNGLKISSTAPVTVYYEVVSSQCQCNPEMYVLKGQNALGKDFWIPSQFLFDNDDFYNPVPHSSFNIVATENNTSITITPSNAIIGHPANVPFNITLNEGQTYAARATSTLAAQHLQGSRVISSKPIAITISDDLLELNSCADLAGDQIVPINLLGKEYIAMSGNMVSPFDQLFITATKNGTAISQNGAMVTTLNAGQSTQLSVGGASTFIQTSQPAYVLQISGLNCEIGLDMLPGVACSGNSTVSFTRSTPEDLFANIVVQSGGQGSFLVNGNPNIITSGQFTAVPGTANQWYSAQISFPESLYPQNSVIKVSNTFALFHLGVLHGGVGTGARFGFFSDYAQLRPNARALNFSLCEGDSLQLIADTLGTATYNWTGPNGFTSNLQNPVIAEAGLSATGEYIVTVSQLGCTTKDTTLTVSVGVTHEKPIAASNSPVCAGGTLYLTSTSPTPGLIYNWTGPNGFTSNSQNASLLNITSAAAGDYIIAINKDGCIAKDTESVAISDCSAFGIPSAFSPNGDGHNDVFKIEAGPGLKEVQFRIFNRWGQIIFETDDVKKGWDGTFKGLPHDTEVFAYIFFAVHESGATVRKAGNITLLR